ncbi:MAG: hypothetical protein ACRYE9_06140 [Janthinobacterium lividum]
MNKSAIEESVRKIVEESTKLAQNTGSGTHHTSSTYSSTSTRDSVTTKNGEVIHEEHTVATSGDLPDLCSDQ